jgi:hypothetical protein
MNDERTYLCMHIAIKLLVNPTPYLYLLMRQLAGRCMCMYIHQVFVLRILVKCIHHPDCIIYTYILYVCVANVYILY